MSTTDAAHSLDTVYESTLRRVQELEYLVDLSQNLTTSLDVDEVLQRIADGVVTILQAFGCVILLLEEDGNTLTPRVVIDPDFKDEILVTSIEVENSLTGKAIKARRGLIFNEAFTVEDAYQIPGTTEDEDESVLSVPLIVDNIVLGAMTVSRMANHFTDTDLWLAEAFGRYAVIALKNAQVHQALQLSNDRFHQLFENMSSGVVIYEAYDNGDDFIITDFNAAGERIGNIDRHDIIGKKVTDIFPEVRNGLLDVIRRVWQTSESERFSLTYYEDDKLLRWRNNYVYKLPTGEIVAVYDDVTEQKQAEIALTKSEARFRTLFETINSGVAIYEAVDDGEDFIFKDFNRAGEQMEQVKREDIIGKRVTEVFSGVREFGLLDVFRQVYRAGNIMEHPISFYADGRVTGWRENYIYKLPSGEIVAVYEDVTTQKQAEIALKESEERFRTLFDDAPVAVWAFDRNGKILNWNKTAERIYGWSAEEAVGKTMFELMVRPENVERTKEGIAAVFRGEEVLNQEFEDVRADGSHVVFLSNEYPLKNETGQVVEGICAEIDITARKEAELALQESEARLRQAQKMESIGTLAGGVAHDFNNLLTAINGQAELGLMKLTEDHPVRRNLEGVLDAGKRAAKLTGQLLAFSRRQMYRPQLVDINKNVLDSQSMLRHLIREDITIEMKLAPNLPPINADPHQLEQILINLVVNARDAIYEQTGVSHKKIITIKTDKIELNKAFAETHPGAKPGNYICFCVSDTGIGMDESVREKIFEPFYTTKPKGHGTGLGMATVYGIVKQNNGYVYVYSEKGRGTTVKIFWTIATDSEVPSDLQKEEDETILVGTETILLAEDDDQVRSFAADSLIAFGYTVMIAENGAHALQLLAENQQPIDLLVTDVIMPQMDGTQLAETLHHRLPDLPVLFMSGYTDDLLGKEGAITQSVHFLQKPFSTHALARKVRAILDGVETPLLE